MKQVVNGAYDKRGNLQRRESVSNLSEKKKGGTDSIQDDVLKPRIGLVQYKQYQEGDGVRRSGFDHDEHYGVQASVGALESAAVDAP